MKTIAKQIEDLGFEIVSDIDHGECFYDFDMLNEFLDNLTKLKTLALRYYNENQAESEEEDK